MKQYIAEIIGDEYKEWNLNQIVFIEAPTGTGKTTFILEKLVEYAALNGRRILYLVNRKILKEQLKNKINIEVKRKLRSNEAISENDLNNAIEVKTYQTIEMMCKGEKNMGYPDDNSSEYHYIIADECHYFFEDSTYNTYTQLSYNWIMSKRQNASLVFMSATINRIKDWIVKDNNLTTNKPAKASDTVSVVRDNKGMLENILESNFAKQYDAEIDYSYIKWKVLKKIEDIGTIISEESGKWLIFVDSINKGEKIKSSLDDLTIDSIFIDAQSRLNNDVIEAVNYVVKAEKFTQSVVIATSVMDNGISINDMELRNLIIMADTPEVFIQMLGRKRCFTNIDNLEEINLYVLQREISEFEKRLADVEQRLKFISEYSDYCSKNRLDLVLENVMKSNIWYKCAKSTCYAEQGSLKLNNFASGQYSYLYEQYRNIIRRFEQEGNYAFIRQQMEWLSVEKKEELIEELMKTVVDEVREVLEKYADRELTSDENQEMRELIRENLKKLLKASEERDEVSISKIIKELGKSSTKRSLSETNFNIIMKTLKMEYKMEKPKNDKFIILRQG